MTNEKDANVIHNLFAEYHYADDLGVIKSKLAEYVATVRKEEREAERKRTLTIIQQMPATAAGADAFRKRVIEEMYRVAALTEKKEDRSEDEHHCYNKGGAL